MPDLSPSQVLPGEAEQQMDQGEEGGAVCLTHTHSREAPAGKFDVAVATEPAKLGIKELLLLLLLLSLSRRR